LLTIAFAEFTRIGFDHIDYAGAAGGLFLRVEETGQWWNLRGGTLMFYYLALALAVGALTLTAWLARTRLGYQWLAVREDEEAARALGVDVFRAKMSAVLISSGLTAVGGVFTAFYSNNLFPSRVFDINRSIEIILAPVVGGLGTVFGPVIGAFILTPLGEVLTALTDRLGINTPGVKAAFYGLALMIIIVLRPAGVWPWLARVLRLTEHRR
jgi:branched-chain amino acid transport system permease protein